MSPCSIHLSGNDLTERILSLYYRYHKRLARTGLCLLKVRDIHDRRGVSHLRIHGKGGKTRDVTSSNDFDRAAAPRSQIRSFERSQK